MNKKARQIGTGLAFLVPNITGFLAFTLFPLVFSLILAFTNWDLRYHNQFQSEPIHFIGVDNFIRLFRDDRFWRFLGNTLFLMMGIPVAMAGSLVAALLLNRKLEYHGRWIGLFLAGVCLCATMVLLAILGLGGPSMLILLGGIVGLLFFGGVHLGGTFYRVLLYTPHFTAGVATFVLWKKLYSPTNGPVNAVLEHPLHALAGFVRQLPPEMKYAGPLLAALGLAALAAAGVSWLLRRWRDADAGTGSTLIGLGALALPVATWVRSGFFPTAAWLPGVVLIIGVIWFFAQVMANRRFGPCAMFKAGGLVGLISLGWIVLGMACLGVGMVLFHLPSSAADGLEPPKWLTDYSWAKPALMIMALWAAIGSNNMILYLAGLSNVPGELEEAATIDGASAWQKFWNVTWPQLAPITFFIFIMSVIHGLQGGFEMARVMTKGGPAGSTTTLSYYIYTEGFETGRLGFASAVAWVLFLIVLLVTLFNWRFGSRYTND